MKGKYVLLACAASFALLFSSCGISPSAESTQDTPAGNEADEPKQDELANALSVYRELLQAAPAVEGWHEEFSDASFDYDENLKQFGEHYDAFTLFDIDRDGVPELLALTTVNFRWTPLSVFTCADGEAVLLKDPLDAAAHGTFEQRSTANGAYYTYICEENHLHNVWRGTNPMGEEEEENRAYELKGTVLSAVDCTLGENENTVSFSDVAEMNTAEATEAMTYGSLQ